VDQGRIGLQQGGEFVVTIAEQRQEAGCVVTGAGAGAGGEEDLDAGGEALRSRG
jgi:hypothetical protein